MLYTHTHTHFTKAGQCSHKHTVAENRINERWASGSVVLKLINLQLQPGTVNCGFDEWKLKVNLFRSARI